MNRQAAKTPMPEQDPAVRSGNFSEVALGYGPEEAKNEAARCAGCKHRPCVEGCPVGVPIPEFIKAIGDGRFDEAYGIIYAQNALPAVCGRVCPQESQCEARCIRQKGGEAVAIGRLERFAADWQRENAKTTPPPASAADDNRPKAAVIGSGPAGLSCAGELAKRGVAVTVFEAFHEPGGVLSYGIPEFRLPKDIVRREIEALAALGVRLECNAVVGRRETVSELLAEGYGAVFIGVGAGLPSFMNIPGEGLIGVYSANEYLTRVNLMKAYLPGADTPILPAQNVVVVGGGNVAMDAARCAKRMGAAQVTVCYRRTGDEMPARAEEIHHAGEEGIAFDFLSAPVSLSGDESGRVASMTCRRMALGEPDASGRRRPQPVPDSDYTLAADAVIVAIGTSPNPLIAQTTPGLAVNNRGCVVTDPETGATSLPGVYAGGDIATGAATVILAMGAGKRAAEAMAKYLGL